MKVSLPLIELEAAREDLERFFQRCLRKLSSDPKSQEMVEELSRTLSTYANRIREAVLVPGIEEPAVFNQVMLGLAVDQPLEAILFPGILDGLSGRLGLTPPGVVDPPTSAREGVSQRWAAALREAVMKIEGRDVNLDQVMPHVVHLGLHQDYDLDFRLQRVDDIAPILTSPMLSGLVSSVRFIGRREVPRGPASPKMEGGLWGPSGAPPGPDVPGPSCISRSAPHVWVAEGNKLYEQGEVDLDKTFPVLNPVKVAAVIILDDDTDFPVDMPQAISTPKIELAWGQKQPLEDRSPRSSPPKKRATEEKEESPPPHEAILPRGVSEEDILPKRYEIFTSDHDWVQSIRGSLLGLEAGTTPSRRDINNSSRFVPRAAASESDLPEVIANHWRPILRREGLLMECPLDQFTTPVDWVPLYTREGF